MSLSEGVEALPFHGMLENLRNGVIPEGGEAVADAVTAVRRRIAWEDAAAPRIVALHTLDALWLPEADVYRHMAACQLSHAEIDTRLELLACRRERLFDLLAQQPVVYICPQAIADAMTINGRCRVSGRQLLTDRDMTLEPATLWKTLAMIVAAAGHQTLRFRWVDALPVGFDVTLYQKRGLCLTRPQDDLFIEQATTQETAAWAESILGWPEGDDPQGLAVLKEAIELLATEGVG